MHTGACSGAAGPAIALPAGGPARSMCENDTGFSYDAGERSLYHGRCNLTQMSKGVR